MAYSDNPIYNARFDAYGIKKYWEQGYKGKGVKVGVIDDFTAQHGYQMISHKDDFAPECELVRYDMRGENYSDIPPLVIQAVNDGCKIISISRSADVDISKMHDAVKYAINKGCLIFCSAGNTGDSFRDWIDIKRYPAAYPETISVLAIDNNYMFSSFSSHGSTGDICGFGQNILVENSDGEEVLVSGTSPTTFDCAMVATLHWCKVLSETGKHPTYDYMMNFVKTNVVDLNEIGKDNFTGYGFFTLDKNEFNRVKLMLLDFDNDGLSQRVNQIKDLVKSGMALESAEKQVNANYYIVGYEILNGVKVPIYGGRKY